MNCAWSFQATGDAKVRIASKMLHGHLVERFRPEIRLLKEVFEVGRKRRESASLQMLRSNDIEKDSACFEP